MSVGGQMREGKSDKEVCVCACVCVCVCVLIPGRTSSESEPLGSSVGVPGIDTAKSRGREKEEKKEQRRERYIQENERDQRAVALLNPTSKTHMRRKTTHRERLREQRRHWCHYELMMMNIGPPQ